MGYRNTGELLADLRRIGQLVEIHEPVDADLEAAAIQRRVFAVGGPAIFFANVKNCRFPMVSNLFGTMERMRYIFRDTVDQLARIVELGVDPTDLLRRPRLLFKVPWWAWRAFPRRVRTGPVLACQTTISQLPQLRSWPKDGGAFITLPQVYTEDPDRPGLLHSNLGMYRIQISGGKYSPDKQIGLHYQLHRDIARHHARALELGKPLRVNIFVGGPPAMTVAATMPLPPHLSELSFAGLLAGFRIPMIVRPGELAISAEADFCIVGHIEPGLLLPEGPFGDHLGYYSLQHDFPVIHVEKVYHRRDAVWPFTVVGRPPQEDSMFAKLIHEIVGPVVPRAIPGVKAVHAVDAAGVHPLCLAIGTEKYLPYEDPRRPRQLLTQAYALLGYGQISLTKYLFIVAEEDNPHLDINDIGEFFRHVLERVDWRRDLHFFTCTNMDTLDYTGPRLHEGSKLVVVAAGPPRRILPVALDGRIVLPVNLGFHDPRVVLPGILVVQGPRYQADSSGTDQAVARFASSFKKSDPINAFPLIVIVDDSDFAARTLENFLWVTFTRSNPASDTYGIEAFLHAKHWGCHGSLVIDARMKPTYPPPVEEDPQIVRRVEALAAPGKPLHGIL